MLYCWGRSMECGALVLGKPIFVIYFCSFDHIVFILIKMIQFEFLQEKLNLSCIHSPMVTELMRGIRTQIEGLISGLPSREMAAMCLGLAHRYCFPILDDYISFSDTISGVLNL